MAKRIVVDAGHGGYDNGASYQGRLEKEDNLRLALQVGEDLKKLGYDVYFTREDDIYQSPSEKAQIANTSGADFFVSLHRNSSAEPGQYMGVQTLVYDDSGIKAQMAGNVSDALSALGFSNLGISVRPNLTVLRRTKMPAILVETGFINTESDNALFDAKFDEIAAAIAQAINETIQENASMTNGIQYRVQVGLYRNYENASRELEKVLADSYPAQIMPSGPYYAVRVGPYSTLDEAAEQAKNLRRSGYETLVVSTR